MKHTPGPWKAVWFQSTHPRGVRQANAHLIEAAPVSIHAPARGATRQAINIRRQVKFQSTHPRGVRLKNPAKSACAYRFQSTHPRGVRQQKLCTRGHSRSFNPRTREGCDFRYYQTLLRRVSIHAPARGATYNPNAVAPPEMFQSTHPRGVRRQVAGSVRPLA